MPSSTINNGRARPSPDLDNTSTPTPTSSSNPSTTNNHPSSSSNNHRPVDFTGPLLDNSKSILDYTTKGKEHLELIKSHAWDKGTTLLLAGPTGIGKTSFLQQLAISFALGRAHLGLVPARAMRWVIVQAENEEIDIARARDGAFAGLQLTAEEKEIVGRRIFIIRNFAKRGVQFFQEVVRPALAHYKPDVFALDPAFAYIGGDANRQQIVGEFMRDWVHSAAQQYKCGAMILHHTPKPLLDGRARKASEQAYAGSGSAEWANFSRLVLTIQTTDHPDHFTLHATKKVRELGWTEGGVPTTFKHIQHAKDRLCWELSSGCYQEPAIGDITKERALQLLEGRMESRAFLEILGVVGASKKRQKQLVSELISAGMVKMSKKSGMVFLEPTGKVDNGE